MKESNKITAQGLEEKKARLEELLHTLLPKAEEELNAARSQGDLSENADYDAAREKFESYKKEIKDIQDIIDHHVLINADDEGGAKTARLGGSQITVLDLSRNKEHTFTIVGSVEADPSNGKISNTCPVAQAIIGHKVGETVTVLVKKPYDLKIVKIA